MSTDTRTSATPDTCVCKHALAEHISVGTETLVCTWWHGSSSCHCIGYRSATKKWSKKVDNALQWLLFGACFALAIGGFGYAVLRQLGLA